MAYTNEVNAITIVEWEHNFENCPNNIFKIFNDNPINFLRSTYEVLCDDDYNYINIYFGIDEKDNPRIIAVGSVLLDGFKDVKPHGFSDVLDKDNIYELYSNSNISLDLARQYTNRWKEDNENSNLYLNSTLLPRINFIELFLVDGSESLLIFFGMGNNSELKVMEKDPSKGDMAIVTNRSFPCPDNCPSQSILNG